MIGCLRRTLPAPLRQNFFWQPGDRRRHTVGAARLIKLIFLRNWKPETFLRQAKQDILLKNKENQRYISACSCEKSLIL
jgi:bifunctional DNA-binding transcriptional regulator/antitoxin component of YhaV-PrlF toxin-antitoxin module